MTVEDWKKGKEVSEEEVETAASAIFHPGEGRTVMFGLRTRF